MWLTCNFSLDYLVYNVQQNGYKKKKSFYLDLRTNSYNKCKRDVKQLEERISKQILEGKGWIQNCFILQSCLGWKKRQNIVTYQPHLATLTYSDKLLKIIPTKLLKTQYHLPFLTFQSRKIPRVWCTKWDQTLG